MHFASLLAAAIISTSANAGTTKPATPGSQTASAPSSSSITVRWSDLSNNESGFRIYRWNGTAWTSLANVGAGVTSYTNPGLSSNTTYYYYVCSYNAVGESCPSTYIQATTSATSGAPKPATPGSQSASAVSSSSITLSWSDLSSNEFGFRIYRWNGSAWAFLTTASAGITSYTNSGLSSSTTYYYYVCSYNAAGESCPSTYVQAATKATSTGTEISIDNEKIKYFYDSYNGNPKISLGSWQAEQITFGSNKVTAKRLLCSKETQDIFKKITSFNTECYGGDMNIYETRDRGRQCVAFVKGLMTTSVATASWRAGRQVTVGDGTLVGKVIARFSVDGKGNKYYGNTSSNHVAIVLSVGKNSITVIDQNAQGTAGSDTEGKIRKHELLFINDATALNANLYNVVEK